MYHLNDDCHVFRMMRWVRLVTYCIGLDGPSSRSKEDGCSDLLVWDGWEGGESDSYTLGGGGFKRYIFLGEKYVPSQ